MAAQQEKLLSSKQEKRDALRYEKSKDAVSALVASSYNKTAEPREARALVHERLDAEKTSKEAELSAAEKRFKTLQKVEFAVGALAIVQIVIFVLRGEPYIVPLIPTTLICLIAYVIVAYMDSRAKGQRQDLLFDIKALKKAKITQQDSGVRVSFD